MSCCQECKGHSKYELKGLEISSSENNRLIITRSIFIDKKLFMKGDLFTLLKSAYYTDRNSFIKAFSNIGISVSEPPEEDIKTLVELNKSGGDLRGDIKKSDGTPIKFNLLDVYNSMNISFNSVSDYLVCYI